MELKSFRQKSFIQQQSEFQQIKEFIPEFQGTAGGVDMIDIEDDGCYYRVSSILKESIEDLKHYIPASGIIWTHSSFCTSSFQVSSLFDKKVCIVRDPRDGTLSCAKFAFTPYMRQYYPSSYSSPEEYLSGEYEQLLDQWVWHVGNYLLLKEKLGVYSSFMKDFYLILSMSSNHY